MIPANPRALDRLSVRARLTVWTVAIVGLSLTLFGVGIRFAVEAVVRGTIDRDLRGKAERFRFPAAMGQAGGPPIEGPDGGPGPQGGGGFRPGDPHGPQGGGFPGPEGNPGGNEGNPRPPRPRDAQPVRVFAPDGTLLLGPPGSTPFSQQAIQEVGVHNRGDEIIEGVGQAQGMRILTRPIITPDGRQAVLQVAIPDDAVPLAVSGVTWALVVLIPGALLLTGAGGTVLADRALRPVGTLADAATRLQATNLSERLPGEGMDEFGRLTAVLNGALARLEEAFERQRRFAADASHELRTPLATIKVNSSLALEDLESLTPDELRTTLRAIDGAADRAERLVRDLLFLARVGALPVRWEPMSLAEVASEAARAVTQASPEPRSPITVRILTQEAALLSDRDHVLRLLTNLLENARRYTPTDGKVTITVRDSGSDKIAVIVADTGAGIAPEHLRRLGEPFYRADAARDRQSGGAGLGLAICKGIVNAVGGHFLIESIVGTGTSVTITLPRRAPNAQPDR